MKTSHTYIKIRGYHIDLYQHANNARYLEFLEEARWNHYEEALATGKFTENKWAFIIVNINISFKKPAYLGQTIDVETSVKSSSSRSVTVQQIVKLKDTDTVCAEADVTFVILGEQGRPLQIEGVLKELLES